MTMIKFSENGEPALTRGLYEGKYHILAGLLLCLWSFAAPNSGPAMSRQDSPGGGKWAILISGASGDRDLQDQYLDQIKQLNALLEGTFEFRKDHIHVLFDDISRDAGVLKLQSTRENVARISKEIAQQCGGEDLVFIFIAGHGSYDGTVYKLNLVGPDPTAEELAAMFYAIPAGRFVVVNTTNCSGASLPYFARKDTIVVVATKSGNEKNQTHFAQYFIESFRDTSGDADKNGRVSILEAFKYASQRIEEFYSKEGSMQTEHPLFSDTGNRSGHSAAESEGETGLLAAATYLNTGPHLALGANASAEKQTLALEAQSIESQIEKLKREKAAMAPADYEDRLESLLLKLAQVHAKLRDK